MTTELSYEQVVTYARELEQKIQHLQEAIMSGPSCKIYFHNEDERHTVTMIAAQHNMKLPEYVRACTIKVTQEIINAREAQVQAQAQAQQPEAVAEEAQVSAEGAE